MEKLLKHIFLLGLLLTNIGSVIAQTVRGTITDAAQTPVVGAVINVSGLPSTKSDNDGKFNIKLPKAGSYMFSLTAMGYLPLNKTLKISSDTIITFELQTAIKQLDAVNIAGQSTAKRVKDQSIRANTIELKEAYTQPATLIEVMNRSSGIKIRQSGGLGSSTDISLNGFQGKSIRYFRDGVPLDYLGDAFSLSALPSNMLQRVEVYKGVLPVSLGADALGGAVNLISRTTTKNQLEASYEIASFNTHRVSLNGYYIDTTKNVFIGLDGFFNHSDNNYKVKVRATDVETRNQYDTTVPLFHNAYTGHFIELYAGVKYKTWADELKLSIAKQGNEKQEQHPALMTDPYGAILGKQSSFIPSLQYSKSLLNQHLKFTQFLTASTLKINRIDTLRGSYDWFGNFTANPSKVGESRQPSNSDISQDNFTSRSNLNFSFANNHRLELNAVYTSASRMGADPLGARTVDTDVDVLSIKSNYNKLVAALGLSSDFLNKKLNHQLIGKFFNYKGSGIEAFQAQAVASNQVKETSGSTWGIADAMKYQFNDKHLVRLSMEYATRLPDQNELFGNAVFVVPNFDLAPERSFNINLGYRYQKEQRYHAEINTFYRRTKNMILLVPIQAPYARYQNQENVKGFGVELEGSVNLTKQLNLNANVTWQELRLFDVPASSGSAEKEGALLRNTPYFFANLGANYHIKQLKVYGYYNFVREYYLETIPRALEPDGFLGLFGSSKVNSLLRIPNQHLLNGGISYPILKNKLNSSFEVKNLLNEDLFDNYRVQKAGRSFHFKLVYALL